MNKQKEQLKRLKREMKENSMSLVKFLNVYYGLCNEMISDIKISHKNIKTLMPELERVSFEELLEGKKDMYIGKIIPVVDSYGDVAPYIAPIIIENVEVQKFTCNNDKIETKLEKVIISESLSEYELSMLCKEFKKQNRQKDYRVATKVLKTKRVGTKDYKNKKLSLKIGGMYNDEY